MIWVAIAMQAKIKPPDATYDSPALSAATLSSGIHSSRTIDQITLQTTTKSHEPKEAAMT